MKSRKPDTGKRRPLENTFALAGASGQDDPGPKPFLVSLALHLALFVLIGLAGGLKSRPAYTPSMIEIDLATLSDGGGASPAVRPPAEAPPPEKKVPPAEKTEVRQPPPKPEPAPEKPQVKKPEMVVSQGKKPQPAPAAEKSEAPRVIRSMKQKTYDPSEVVQSTIKQLEKKVETATPQPSYLSAIERLKETVGEEAPKAGTEGDRPGREGEGIPGGKGAHGKRTLHQLDIYHEDIRAIIQRNWAFPEQLAVGRDDLEAILVITIAANGQITNIWFETKSGNRYVDDAAYKAVKKSNPLPPLPPGVSSHDVGMIFTPSGLK